MKKRLLWTLLPLTVLGLDWTSKAWILRHLREGELKPIIPNFFNLWLGYNKGAIFGSFSSAPEWLRLSLFSIAGVIALFYFGRLFYGENTHGLERTALGLILGGALGNGFDRLQHGAVVDFLDFIFWGWHYWAFNLADSAIVCGATLYGLHLLASKRRSLPSNHRDG